MAYALFIRTRSLCPHARHTLTRYGSRENSAFSVLVLSVRICTDISWGVSASHAGHGSEMLSVLGLVAIVSSHSAGEWINRDPRSVSLRGQIALL